jgi:CRP-like cAMP-binding protein
VLAGGEAEVSDEGRGLGTVGRGEGVGEIALLYDVPRTATVVARTPVDAYRIDSETFLEAMRGPTASAIAERIAATRLERSGFL